MGGLMLFPTQFISHLDVKKEERSCQSCFWGKVSWLIKINCFNKTKKIFWCQNYFRYGVLPVSGRAEIQCGHSSLFFNLKYVKKAGTCMKKYKYIIAWSLPKTFLIHRTSPPVLGSHCLFSTASLISNVNTCKMWVYKGNLVRNRPLTAQSILITDDSGLIYSQSLCLSKGRHS